MKIRINESAKDDYRAKQRYNRLAPRRTDDHRLYEFPDGHIGFYTPPPPSDEEIESEASFRKMRGEGSHREANGGLNRTERRISSDAPLSMNDYDREDIDDEYRTDITSIGSLGGSDSKKIKSGLANLFYDIADIVGDSSVSVALRSSADRVFKSLLSGDPSEAAEKLEDIASTAKDLSETMNEVASSLSSRWNTRKAFNDAADRRKLPESVRMPLGGRSITEMRLLNEDFDEDIDYINGNL